MNGVVPYTDTDKEFPSAFTYEQEDPERCEKRDERIIDLDERTDD